MNNEIMNKMIDNRIIFINSEINDTLAQRIIMELLYLDSQNNEDINLYINSPGGDVMAGLAIIDVIQSIKSKVNTICIGKCYSMAAIILAIGNKGKRAILPNSEVMIHEVNLSHICGTTKEILHIANLLNGKNKKILKILSSNTKLSIQELSKITKSDYFMDAQEAKAKGFVDTIITNN